MQNLELTRKEREILEHVAIALELADMMLNPIVPSVSQEKAEKEDSAPFKENNPIRSTHYFLGFAKFAVGAALNEGEEVFPTAYLSGLFQAMAEPILGGGGH